MLETKYFSDVQALQAFNEYTNLFHRPRTFSKRCLTFDNWRLGRITSSSKSSSPWQEREREPRNKKAQNSPSFFSFSSSNFFFDQDSMTDPMGREIWGSSTLSPLERIRRRRSTVNDFLDTTIWLLTACLPVNMSLSQLSIKVSSQNSQGMWGLTSEILTRLSMFNILARELTDIKEKI